MIDKYGYLCGSKVKVFLDGDWQQGIISSRIILESANKKPEVRWTIAVVTEDGAKYEAWADTNDQDHLKPST